MPGYGQQRASGGTAITAAVLVLILTMLSALSLVTSLIALSAVDAAGEAEFAASAAAPMVVINGGFVVLGFLGSILTFRRKAAGRVIIIILSSLGLIGSVIGTVIASNGPVSGPIVASTLIGGGIALLILCLAAAPSTGRWIREPRQATYGPQPYY
ncbi:hypothetical protein ACFXK0_04300 [Nocardia sp. NPDC059177]|uniref:hypothetical protein n=1 Tax=Nocardia sp. NPDC059177 TaxID=3346759 RepID=UPI0036AED590